MITARRLHSRAGISAKTDCTTQSPALFNTLRKPVPYLTPLESPYLWLSDIVEVDKHLLKLSSINTKKFTLTCIVVALEKRKDTPVYEHYQTEFQSFAIKFGT